MCLMFRQEDIYLRINPEKFNIHIRNHVRAHLPSEGVFADSILDICGKCLAKI